MDLASVVGFALAFVSIMWSIWLGGSFIIFVDVPSIVLIFGGVAATTMIKWPMEVLKDSIKIYLKVIFGSAASPKAMIDEIIKLGEIARRESVFALEKVPVEDKFLKKAVTLAADNRPPEIISSVLGLEIAAMEERHGKGADVMDGIGADGPAMGMVGTLMGLVQMLQNMSDPSSIGPAMAVALLTTFYGAIIANVFCLPVAIKLKARSKEESARMNIIVAGVLGIVAGENPRTIREKLESFLPPKERTVEEKKE
ncbi:MAG: MotA/TolQ/ExbB proton channel family protein [Bacteriovoracaceae bacterium]|nr:MotA/TolQ/ExbB proton channel family protein [Bacteriovoracaceae bacterium]